MLDDLLVIYAAHETTFKWAFAIFCIVFFTSMLLVYIIHWFDTRERVKRLTFNQAMALEHDVSLEAVGPLSMVVTELPSDDVLEDSPNASVSASSVESRLPCFCIRCRSRVSHVIACCEDGFITYKHLNWDDKGVVPTEREIEARVEMHDAFEPAADTPTSDYVEKEILDVMSMPAPVLEVPVESEKKAGNVRNVMSDEEVRDLIRKGIEKRIGTGTGNQDALFKSWLERNPVDGGVKTSECSVFAASRGSGKSMMVENLMRGYPLRPTPVMEDVPVVEASEGLVDWGLVPRIPSRRRAVGQKSCGMHNLSVLLRNEDLGACMRREVGHKDTP